MSPVNPVEMWSSNDNLFAEVLAELTAAALLFVIVRTLMFVYKYFTKENRSGARELPEENRSGARELPEENRSGESPVSSPAEPDTSSPAQNPPDGFGNKSLSVEDYRRLYEVGEKLEHFHGMYEGRMKTDGQKVTIRYIKLQPSEQTLSKSAKLTKPFSEERLAVLQLQQNPNCEHIIGLVDCFTVGDNDVLIMERVDGCITLGRFIKIVGKRLKEKHAKKIMCQLFTALNYCWDRGVYFPIDVDKILMNPRTLKIKIVDFSQAKRFLKGREEADTEELLRENVKLKYLADLCNVMEALVRNIRRPFWKRSHLSKECSDLLNQLRAVRGIRLLGTLENISNYRWFLVP